MAAQKIMICDDQIMIHETLGMYLENEGYEHISAMDGEEALQKFETEKPDLIILDIILLMYGMVQIKIFMQIQ